MVVGHAAGTGINKMGPPWKVKRESLLDQILGGMQNVTGWFQQIVPPPSPAGWGEVKCHGVGAEDCRRSLAGMGNSTGGC